MRHRERRLAKRLGTAQRAARRGRHGDVVESERRRRGGERSPRVAVTDSPAEPTGPCGPAAPTGPIGPIGPIGPVAPRSSPPECLLSPQPAFTPSATKTKRQDEFNPTNPDRRSMSPRAQPTRENGGRRLRILVLELQRSSTIRATSVSRRMSPASQRLGMSTSVRSARGVEALDGGHLLEGPRLLALCFVCTPASSPSPDAAEHAPR